MSDQVASNAYEYIKKMWVKERSAGRLHEFPCRLITLNIHSSLSAVEFLTVITCELAKAKISVNAVSAFYHDHLFVPSERAEEAMKILKGLTESAI